MKTRSIELTTVTTIPVIPTAARANHVATATSLIRPPIEAYIRADSAANQTLQARKTVGWPLGGRSFCVCVIPAHFGADGSSRSLQHRRTRSTAQPGARRWLADCGSCRQARAYEANGENMVCAARLADFCLSIVQAAVVSGSGGGRMEDKQNGPDAMRRRAEMTNTSDCDSCPEVPFLLARNRSRLTLDSALQNIRARTCSQSPITLRSSPSVPSHFLATKQLPALAIPLGFRNGTSKSGPVVHVHPCRTCFS